MIMFESHLGINSNTAIIEIRLALYLYYDYILLIWKKVTKMASCCIICNLTTKSMPAFWAGDKIQS